jgi:CCR4-NOT transcription complex subunit 9
LNTSATTNNTQATSGVETTPGGNTNMDGGISEENRRVLAWVAELMDPNRRETALMELSKKREQVPELALIIWHSFGMLKEDMEVIFR